MIILDDLRVEMTGYRKEMTELADVLDIKAAKARIEQLGEETAKPASITSTFSSSSCLAISIFSDRFMLHPGDCSPSRSVV